MSQNSLPHSAHHSGLTQICNALDTPRNFQGTTMAPLCSRKGLVGLVPKGRWCLSWTNCHYEQNLSSLIQMKLETSIKWMEASRIPTSKESAPYIMCYESYVHCEYDTDGITQHHAVAWRQMVNAAYYCMFLQPHLHPAFMRKRHLVVQNHIILHNNEGVIPLLLSQTFCATDNGRCWNIHCTQPIWVHVITISSSKRKNHYEGPDTFYPILVYCNSAVTLLNSKAAIQVVTNIWKSSIKERL